MPFRSQGKTCGQVSLPACLPAYVPALHFVPLLQLLVHPGIAP